LQADSTFQPNDSLVANCVYDSRGADRSMTYGVAHGDEMCAFILFYYPADPAKLHDLNHVCTLFPKRDAVDKDRHIMEH
jgi:hypothetical protein